MENEIEKGMEPHQFSVFLARLSLNELNNYEQSVRDTYSPSNDPIQYYGQIVAIYWEKENRLNKTYRNKEQLKLF